jgi:hypothetical protein
MSVMGIHSSLFDVTDSFAVYGRKVLKGGVEGNEADPPLLEYEKDLGLNFVFNSESLVGALTTVSHASAGLDARNIDQAIEKVSQSMEIPEGSNVIRRLDLKTDPAPPGDGQPPLQYVLVTTNANRDGEEITMRFDLPTESYYRSSVRRAGKTTQFSTTGTLYKFMQFVTFHHPKLLTPAIKRDVLGYEQDGGRRPSIEEERLRHKYKKYKYFYQRLKRDREEEFDY